jgi:murein DD-endopeptidase MepM/ murein hydrolase activator NlpD
VGPLALPKNRLFSAALIAVLILASLLAPEAQGRRPLDEVKDRLAALQDELDRAVAHLEELRNRENGLLFGIARIEERIRDLEADEAALQGRVTEAATRLYMTTGTDTLEVLLSSETFADLAGRSQTLSHISELDRAAFDDLERTERELAELQSELTEKAEELTSTRSRVAAETAAVQARFQEVSARYDELKQRVAAALPTGTQISASGMTCPIAAANSFIDSWGFPRPGGRTHEGTDMMAAMGAPVVAITEGRITFAGVGTTAGNWLILSGDDGNEYWYMHNRQNLVTSGRVRVGEQIATVGDTGNAIGGPPHVHFEYHPGGGGPANPYELLAGICRSAR